jgi:ABC-2 type transport system permease protein
LAAARTAAVETLERPFRERLAHHARIVHVTAAAEFKLKYSGSALGYVWSVVKPLGLFGMLYIVFGRFMKLGNIPHYPIYLLTGLVLWTYFADASMLSMQSLVSRGGLISKLAFPRLIVPLSVSTTAAMTLGVNLVAVAIFVGANRLIPTLNWLLLLPLMLYLFVVTVGVGMILSPLFVRLRDVSQVWELVLQLMFYASPIIYPASFLPPWWKPIAFLSPLVQIMQDARALIIPGSPVDTPTTIYGGWWGQLIPFTVAMLIVGGGFAYFRREAPTVAERI